MENNEIKDIITKAKRIVFKFGTNILRNEDKEISLSRIYTFIEDIAKLKKHGKEPIIVTSGAVGLGAKRLSVDSSESMSVKQACAAVGQSRLMSIYEDGFDKYGIITAQILLTEEDFTHRRKYLSLHDTLNTLINLGTIPVINQNDTVSTEELDFYQDAFQVCFSDNDKLSAHLAYIEALYRHRPALVSRLKELTDAYSGKHASDVGQIGCHVTIINTGAVKNVRIGDYARIEGASSLQNGSINSNALAPVHVGCGVICEDFIMSSGAHVDDGAMLSRCFVGQACRLGHNYSATDSLFFSNCQGENGEACAIFAGPYTVTHHKSTLLIAGMFSFMNAGSGSNQSNHMYKLGPIHQGGLERGAKTTSDSYILWPARVGAFSLVMGRHVTHADTSNLPFSYLIEQKNTTYLVPGVNLRSVGTIRDAQKWPKRDKRTDTHRLDCINYNLLSPYTVQKMMKGRDILLALRKASGELSDTYSFQSAKIKNSSLKKGISFYETAIYKFMGNSIIKRLEGIRFKSDEEIRARLLPDTEIGAGDWVDIAGLIAPKSEVDRLMADIESGKVNRLGDINERFAVMHGHYYTYEWTWAYGKIENVYGIDPGQVTASDVIRIVRLWKEAVVGLDKMVYEDARKEFSLSSMTGFGVDGSRREKQEDFEQVRGDFESNPFVTAVLKHIEVKSALGDELIGRMEKVAGGSVSR